MPLNRSETYTAPGTTVSWNLDPSIAPFNAAIACWLSTDGSVSYKLQYSYDLLSDPKLTDADASWIDSTDIPAGTSGDGFSSFSFPVARIRLVIASLTGSLKMQMLQGMSIN